VVNFETQVKQEFKYRALALKSGEFSIGPIKVKADGKDFQTEKVQIKIHEKDDIDKVQSENVKVWQEIDGKEYYLGEQINYKIFFAYRNVQLSNIRLEDSEVFSTDFLVGDPVQIQSVVVDAMEVDIDQTFGQTASRIHKALNDLKPTAEAVDATLGRSVEATRAAVVNEMNDLKQRVVRAEKRQQDEVRAQIEKVCVNLMPTRNLQERTLNPTYFFNKYSMDLLDTIRAHIDVGNASHRLIQL
ncbi:MAG: bacillithiol biosynthesis BshC, partial [Longimonas sp.]|uniref:BatD family protein n=1 Tax=Longimonas sp. TaxID=2039626 RepID=UPI003974775F